MAPQGWLDIHGHFFPPLQSSDQQSSFVQSMHDLKFMVAPDWTWSIEDSLAYNDTAGIQMQMLSYQPSPVSKLLKANTYGASIVEKYPSRFGLLCALPTDNVEACLQEIERGKAELRADGFCVSAIRDGVMLSNPSLEPVWKKLDSMGATVWSHPNAYCAPRDGRPSPLIEVAFETCRVIVDMLYRKIFLRYPNIRFVFSHSGGVLPILAGRVELLGAEDWVPNPEKLSREDIRAQLQSIYVDTAATASTGMEPAIKMCGKEHIIYGSDCGVPCSTHETMELNRKAVLQIEQSLGIEMGTVGRNGWDLFPEAVKRIERANMK